MSIVMALAVAVIAALQYYDIIATQIWAANYMIWAVIMGAVMGDPLTGLIIGATVQLMSLGVAALGGSSVPNYGMVAVISTALTISTGQPMAVGVAVGIAVGTLWVELDVLVKITNGFIVRKSQRYCEHKKFKSMEHMLLLCPVVQMASVFIPTFIVCVFGQSVADFITQSLPSWFTGGLTIATGMLPVVGMALLLGFMPAKKYFGFVAVGFVLSAYLQLGVLPIAILGAAVAFEYYKKQSSAVQTAVSVGRMDEDE